MSSRSSNYVLTQPFSFGRSNDMKTLEPGTFVRPLNIKYVPQHVIDHADNKYFKADAEVYCYCRYGILAIPKASIKEVA